MYSSKQDLLLQRILDTHKKGQIQELVDQRDIQAGKIYKIKTEDDEFLILKYSLDIDKIKIKFNNEFQLKLYTKIWHPMIIKSISKIGVQTQSMFIHKDAKYFTVFES